MITSLLLVLLITDCRHFDLDISKVKIEDIYILEVFCHNFITMFLSTIFDTFSAGIYNFCISTENIVNIGVLSNAFTLIIRVI